MGWNGELVSIHVRPSPGAPLADVREAEAVAGRGLRGDHRFDSPAGPDREITLIEVEALEALKRDCRIDLGPGESRRNLVTRGVPLNHLVGVAFRVGPVLLRGHRLCEPCDHLEKLTAKPGVKDGLLHRGGLRAQIVEGGPLRAGDPIRPQ